MLLSTDLLIIPYGKGFGDQEKQLASVSQSSAHIIWAPEGEIYL